MTNLACAPDYRFSANSRGLIMSARPRIAGVMLTMTTYGTWLRGDARGWTEDGQLWPPEPLLEQDDRQRLKFPSFRFASDELDAVGNSLGRGLIERLNQVVLALAVQSWHVHFVVAESDVLVPNIAHCAKQAVRYALKKGCPIWTDGYDKRYCFGAESLAARIAYVERHNVQRGLLPAPGSFIAPLDLF